MLEILKDHGFNWVRLRLFHTPTKLPNDLAYTTALAKSAKGLGYRFLLDLHYSDTWADPGKQFLPKAWEGKTHAELVQAVFDYTRDSLAALREAGVMPEMVQVGNEVSAGMLWPDGKLPAHWDNFADLLKAGIKGVAAGAGDAPRPRVMIHIDRAADQKRTQYFFDRLLRYGVEFDVIGQSYYPWFHGSLLEVRENLAFMAETYAKDIVLVETCYPWRNAEYHAVPGPYPETPEGQRDFLDELQRIALAAPQHRCIGIFWWEPIRPRAGDAHGMFDAGGNALPVLGVFDKWTRGKHPQRKSAEAN